MIFLISLVSVFSNVLQATQEKEAEESLKREYGYWHYLTDDFNALTGDKTGYSYQLTTVQQDSYSFLVSSFDITMFDLASLTLIDGRLPENKDEVVVDFDSLSRLGYDYTLNQDIVVSINQSEVHFSLVGIIAPIANKWIVNSVMPTYPSLITTGYESQEVIAFGYDKMLEQDDQMDANWVANISSYPDLAPLADDITHTLKNERILIFENQLRNSNYALLGIGLFVIGLGFLVYRDAISTHISKMRLLGVARIHAGLYIGTSAFVYALAAVILSYISKWICLFIAAWIVSPGSATIHDGIFKDTVLFLGIGTFVVYSMLTFPSLYYQLVGRFVVVTKKRIVIKKILNMAGVVVLYGTTIVLVMGQVSILQTELTVDYEVLKESQAYSSMYEFWVVNDAYDNEGMPDGSAPCNGFGQLNCGLSEADVDDIRNQSGIASVVAVSTVNVRSVYREDGTFLADDTVSVFRDTDSYQNSGLLLYVYNDDTAPLIEQAYSISLRPEFYGGSEGVLAIDPDAIASSDYDVSSQENILEVAEDESIYMGETHTPIRISHVVSIRKLNISTETMIFTKLNSMTAGVLMVHESFLTRLGLSADRYQIVFAKPETLNNYEQLDRYMSRYSKIDGVQFSNQRLVSEMIIAPVLSQMMTYRMQILISAFIGCALIASLIVSNLWSQRKTFALERIMGYRKSQIVLRMLFRFTIPLWVIIPLAWMSAMFYMISIRAQRLTNIVYDTQRLFQWDGNVRLIFWVTFCIVSWIVGVIACTSLIIIKKNPLDALDEREV